MSESSAEAAGWMDDPDAPGQLRWWDGSAWTDHVRPMGTPTGLPPATSGVTVLHGVQASVERRSPISRRAKLSVSLPALLGPFGAIPGIAFGMLAIRDMRRDPGIGGFRMAVTGLVLSALNLLSIPLLIAFLAPVFSLSHVIEAKANLRAAQSSIEMCAARSPDGKFVSQYGRCDAAALLQADPQLSSVLSGNEGGAVQVQLTGPDDYTLTSTAGKRTYSIRRTATSVQQLCSPIEPSTCPTGNW